MHLNSQTNTELDSAAYPSIGCHASRNPREFANPAKTTTAAPGRVQPSCNLFSMWSRSHANMQSAGCACCSRRMRLPLAHQSQEQSWGGGSTRRAYKANVSRCRGQINAHTSSGTGRNHWGIARFGANTGNGMRRSAKLWNGAERHTRPNQIRVHNLVQ